MLGLAAGIIAARRAAETHGCVATVGKVHVEPGGVNAIASRASGWLDARGTDADAVLRVVADVREVVSEFDGLMTQESWTPTTDFDPLLARRIAHDARRPAGHRHGRGPRRRHPGERRHPRRDALRPQPHRRLALARRVGLAPTTASPASRRSPPCVTDLAGAGA